MIVNACAVALARRPVREADRLVTLYTQSLGKVTARFIGVDRPGRKLKALSEPLVWAEYRLYLSPSLDSAKVIGGQLLSTFPALRCDLGRTLSALSCCEMLNQLTAQPRPRRA